MSLVTKFDPIEYVKELRKAGVTQEVAEVQAQAIERVIDDVTKNKDLATRQDIEASKQEVQITIANLRVELIKWILGTGIATLLALAGIIKYLH